MRKLRRWSILVGALVLLALYLASSAGPAIEEGSALVLDLGGSYVEASVSPLTARLLGQSHRPMVSLLSELAKAERDDRLTMIVLRIRSMDVGWGKAQEIRGALERLREKGRVTVAYLELEKYGGNLEYYIASAADEIVMAPGARNPFLGLAAEYLFYGDLFESLGIEVEYERVGKYKTAVESFTGSKMSPANREMTTALLDSIESQFIQGVAAGRGLEPGAVHEAIDAAPASPEEMRQLGLIDEIGFFDEVLAQRGDPPVVYDHQYRAVDPASIGFDPVAEVALIYGSGMVVTGEGTSSPGGGPVLASTTVAEAIDAAAEDAGIAAILFRIDSPGGSALASDIVWRAVQKAQEAGKPVVASFSDVAASGGYYVAAGADRIVALPGTITGSIGVFVLRPVIGGLLDKLGVGVESMTRGAHADLLLMSKPLSPRTRDRLRAEVQSVYALFVERVADGRPLEAAEVDRVGRGRVFTGEQALEAGLVDTLGGMREAVLAVKESLGLDADADVALVPYPPPKPLVAQLRETLGASLHLTVVELPELPLLEELRRTLTGLPVGAPVLVPPVFPRIR